MIRRITDQLMVAKSRKLIARYNIMRLRRRERAIISIQFFPEMPKSTVSKLIKHFQKQYCAYIERTNESTIVLDVDEARNQIYSIRTQDVLY